MIMRFHGKIGYGIDVETSPGVYKKQIVEKSYYGDVNRDMRRIQGGETVNPNITINNTISIIAKDDYAYSHFYDIMYVVWRGSKWKVNSVEVQRPRLILSLGELYNGD